MDREKEKIKEIIKKAILSEERLIPIYFNHLRSGVFWTGLPENDVKRARELMEILMKDSERHRDILQELLAKIK